MSRRIVIIGGPHVGKTTLSLRLKDELGISNTHHSDDIKHLGWSESSEFASKWFDQDGDFVVEGVQAARALRKWLKANPGKPLDVDILALPVPQTLRVKGQESMDKGVWTVFSEIRRDLESRGARVHKLKDPNHAIDIFRSQYLGEAESQQQRKPMLIEYTKEQYDSLPPAQQKLCTEKDGKYTFEFETPSEVAGLKQNRDKVLADLKKAKEDLAGYSGIDPTKYAELVKAHEDAERAALEGKGQWQVLEQQLKDQNAQREKQLVDKHQKEIDDRESRIKSLSDALEAKLVDAEAIAALSKHTKAVNLLMPHVKSRIKVVDEDGKFVARVIDEKGNPRIGDAQGTPMTIEQLVEEMKASDDYLRAFDANTAGGGGASNGGNGLASGADLSKLSPVERLKAANKAGVTT